MIRAKVSSQIFIGIILVNVSFLMVISGSSDWHNIPDDVMEEGLKLLAELSSNDLPKGSNGYPDYCKAPPELKEKFTDHIAKVKKYVANATFIEC